MGNNGQGALVPVLNQIKTIPRRTLYALKMAGVAFRKIPTTISEIDAAMDAVIDGMPTYAGTRVNRDTALSLSAIFNAVLQISQMMASTQMVMYERIDENSKRRVRDHPTAFVFNGKANEIMTSYIFKEISTQHILLKGNAYSFKVTDRTGDVVGLLPIDPDLMKPKREKGRLVYEFKPRGNKPAIIYPKESIFHIPGFGYDGLQGYSVLKLANNSFGTALASEEHAGRTFSNGGTLRGVLKHPGKFQDRNEAIKNIRESWQKVYAGPGNQGKVAILEEGMDFQPMSMNPEELQMLESRTFNVTEIARWFNMPPHKLKELSRATYDNISSEQLSYYVDTLLPHFVRWEQHALYECIDADEWDKYYFEFTIDNILRADVETRNKAYEIQRRNGILNANEWRRKDNMNPIDGKGGDDYFIPLNWTKMGEEIKPPKDEDITALEDTENNTIRQLVVPKQRSILDHRRKVAESYRESFKKIISTILNHDRKDILKIANDNFQGRSIATFNEDIDTYYRNRFPQVRKKYATVYIPFLNEIYPIAMEEINAEGEPDALADQYTDEFIDNSSVAFLASSRGQIKQVARVALEKQEDPVEAVEKRLDEWDEKRPDKIAHQETIDGECGGAQFIYFQNGFKTRWVTHGESCPYCKALDGRAISQGGAFLNAGQSFEPFGAENGPLNIRRTVRHPQAHAGCDCQIRATI